MQRIISSLTAAFLISAGVAQADTRCAVPMTDWQPRDAVARLAQEKGWTVRRIKIDDGCYEIKGTDAQGRRIEAKIHPGTLAVVEFELDDDDRRDRDRGDDRDDD